MAAWWRTLGRAVLFLVSTVYRYSGADHDMTTACRPQPGW